MQSNERFRRMTFNSFWLYTVIWNQDNKLIELTQIRGIFIAWTWIYGIWDLEKRLSRSSKITLCSAGFELISAAGNGFAEASRIDWNFEPPQFSSTIIGGGGKNCDKLDITCSNIFKLTVLICNLQKYGYA